MLEENKDKVQIINKLLEQESLWPTFYGIIRARDNIEFSREVLGYIVKEIPLDFERLGESRSIFSISLDHVKGLQHVLGWLISTEQIPSTEHVNAALNKASEIIKCWKFFLENNQDMRGYPIDQSHNLLSKFEEKYKCVLEKRHTLINMQGFTELYHSLASLESISDELITIYNAIETKELIADGESLQMFKYVNIVCKYMEQLRYYYSDEKHCESTETKESKAQCIYGSLDRLIIELKQKREELDKKKKYIGNIFEKSVVVHYYSNVLDTILDIISKYYTTKGHNDTQKLEELLNEVPALLCKCSNHLKLVSDIERNNDFDSVLNEANKDRWVFNRLLNDDGIIKLIPYLMMKKDKSIQKKFSKDLDLYKKSLIAAENKAKKYFQDASCEAYINNMILNINVKKSESKSATVISDILKLENDVNILNIYLDSEHGIYASKKDGKRYYEFKFGSYEMPITWPAKDKNGNDIGVTVTLLINSSIKGTIDEVLKVEINGKEVQLEKKDIVKLAEQNKEVYIQGFPLFEILDVFVGLTPKYEESIKVLPHGSSCQATPPQKPRRKLPELPSHRTALEDTHVSKLNKQQESNQYFGLPI